MILNQHNIKQHLQEYFKNKPVKKAYLFGSFAKDAAKKSSDVDIIVELDYSKKIGLDFIKWNYELEQFFGRKTDLVPEDTMYESIKKEADKYKVLVFQN